VSLLITIQILDGVGAGIFGVLSVLVIAQLTQGTGRFNLAQGAVATAIGIGAALSNLGTGVLVKRAGYGAGFVALSIAALLGLAVYWRWMPETAGDSPPRR
jgi:dipeptide/tripeptide permease